MPETELTNVRVFLYGVIYKKKSTYLLLATFIARALHGGIAPRRRRGPRIAVAVFIVVAGCGALEASGVCAVGALERMR